MVTFAARWLKPGAASSSPQSAKRDQTLRWFVKYLRPAAPQLLLVMLLSLAAVAAGLAQPYLTKRLIDDGLLAGRHDVVWEVALSMVALALLAFALGATTRLLYVATSAKILHSVREALFAHLLSLSPDFFVAMRQGDIMVRLDSDIAEIQRFAVDLLLSALNNTVMLVGSLFLLYQLSPPLTEAMMLILLLNAFLLRLLRPQIESLSRSLRERGANVASFLMEILGASKSVQSYNGQQREHECLVGLHRELRRDTLRLQFVGYTAGSLPGFILSLGTVAVFVFGSQSIQGHEAMTLGMLIAFVSYVQKASGPVQSLMGQYVALQRARVSLDRVSELAATPARVLWPQHPDHLPGAGRGEIVLAGVAFRYPESERAVLEGADLRLPAGSRVLLRGRSGAGKSTLADLLQRHFDPEHGSITLDGVDLRNLACGELRRAVVVVAQDTALFSCSIADNIRYGRPAATLVEVQEAARRARVEEFALELPDGLETTVGQRGAALSGGQRQRIAVARAILLDPRVLILDESTAAMDAGLETDILNAIDRLFPDRTRIVVSHRNHLEENFDIVVDLEEGGLSIAQRKGTEA
jgi:ATP-binding cassette subfamily B protein